MYKGKGSIKDGVLYAINRKCPYTMERVMEILRFNMHQDYEDSIAILTKIAQCDRVVIEDLLEVNTQ
jgi:ATP-dependent RNA circularization protein (DNA/RNA ligase family)